MEPIRIQRRLGQFSLLSRASLLSRSSLSLSLLFLPLLIHDGREGGGWSAGQATFRTPTDSLGPFLPLFSRRFPIYRLSPLYEPPRYVLTESANIISTTRGPCNLAEVRTSPNVCFSSRHLSTRTSSRRINILYPSEFINYSSNHMAIISMFLSCLFDKLFILLQHEIIWVFQFLFI